MILPKVHKTYPLHAGLRHHWMISACNKFSDTGMIGACPKLLRADTQAATERVGHNPKVRVLTFYTKLSLPPNGRVQTLEPTVPECKRLGSKAHSGKHVQHAGAVQQGMAQWTKCSCRQPTSSTLVHAGSQHAAPLSSFR